MIVGKPFPCGRFLFLQLLYILTTISIARLVWMAHQVECAQEHSTEVSKQVITTIHIGLSFSSPDTEQKLIGNGILGMLIIAKYYSTI